MGTAGRSAVRPQLHALGRHKILACRWSEGVWVGVGEDRFSKRLCGNLELALVFSRCMACWLKGCGGRGTAICGGGSNAVYIWAENILSRGSTRRRWGEIVRRARGVVMSSASLLDSWGICGVGSQVGCGLAVGTLSP
ncbi:hypothetical protein Tco_0280487 [Tanacetum coccineum]